MTRCAIKTRLRRTDVCSVLTPARIRQLFIRCNTRQLDEQFIFNCIFIIYTGENTELMVTLDGEILEVLSRIVFLGVSITKDRLSDKHIRQKYRDRQSRNERASNDMIKAVTKVILVKASYSQ